MGLAGEAKMENGVNRALHVEVLGDVLPLEAERRVTAQMRDVVQAAGQEVVDGDTAMPRPRKWSQKCEPRNPAPPSPPLAPGVEGCRTSPSILPWSQGWTSNQTTTPPVATRARR